MNARAVLPFACLVVAIGLSGCFLMPKPAHHWARSHGRSARQVRRAHPPRPRGRDVLHAVQAIEQRDYGLALEILAMAKEVRADDPRVLSALGVVYDKLGRFDLSGRYYDLAEKADPGSKVVAIDRRYSEFLQQAMRSERPVQSVVIAQGPAVSRQADVIMLPAAPQMAQAGLLGGPVRVRNATGRADGISRLAARLTSKGLTLAPSPGVEMGVLATTKVDILPAPLGGDRLARTLEFPVRLEFCAQPALRLSCWSASTRWRRTPRPVSLLSGDEPRRLKWACSRRVVGPSSAVAWSWRWRWPAAARREYGRSVFPRRAQTQDHPSQLRRRHGPGGAGRAGAGRTAHRRRQQSARRGRHQGSQITGSHQTLAASCCLPAATT